MSGYRPRPYLQATMGPRAASVWLRAASVIERHADELAGGTSESRLLAAEIRASVDSMRESVRQWRERADADEMSGSGHADVRVEALTADSGLDLHGVPPSRPMWWSVEEVATRCRVTTRHVRRLCAEESLVATKVGRTWQIDPDSVEALLIARRAA